MKSFIAIQKPKASVSLHQGMDIWAAYREQIVTREVLLRGRLQPNQSTQSA